VTLPLHEEAVEDLRKSGLSDATIAAAGLYTPPPGDLPRLLSPRLVDKVRHVLVFPHDGASPGIPMRRADEFVRCKLFPPVSDGQGHTVRYYQRAGTPPRLYVPAPARAALTDPAVPLLITEGEKKALKANREGLASLAVGGLWNWQTGGRPIADLDRIDWVDREMLIVPDSDVWTRPDLVQPVFALGKELEGRGAKVTVLKLPSVRNGTKTGLDDYLRAHPREAFDTLPRLPLKHAALGRASAWWREWVKRKDAEPPAGEPTVLELLERGETTRFLHPGLDVVDALPAPSAQELLDALLGTDPGLAHLQRLMIERTQGNPFFLEESVRALVEMRALTGERGAYRLVGPIQSLQLPATAQAILAARIDRLAPGDKRLLQAAALASGYDCIHRSKETRTALDRPGTRVTDSLGSFFLASMSAPPGSESHFSALATHSYRTLKRLRSEWSSFRSCCRRPTTMPGATLC
jgi:hypothetical protein